jgi:ABC-2 type transport system ATP-binding protein
LHTLRSAGEIALTIANYDGHTESLLNGLGAARVENVPLSVEDAFLSYLEDRGERSFLLPGAGGVQ